MSHRAEAGRQDKPCESQRENRKAGGGIRAASVFLCSQPLMSRSGTHKIRILAGLEKDDFCLCVPNVVYEFKCGKRIYLAFLTFLEVQGLWSGQSVLSKLCETPRGGHIHSVLFQLAGSLDVNFPL